jgi:hypothetical protein
VGTHEQLTDGAALPPSSAESLDKEFSVRINRTAAAAAMAAALALGALGGAGIAQAKPHGPDPCGPLLNCWPPGHNDVGPPGQIMNGNPVVPGLTGVPPGHWGETWLPDNWVDLGIPGPLPVVWNPDLLAWGVWWANQFIPSPLT